MKRSICKVRPTARVAHQRITTESGEEGQVDCGTGPMIRDPATGKCRTPQVVCADSWMLSQVCLAIGVEVECDSCLRACQRRVPKRLRLQ